MAAGAEALGRTPLHDRHVAAGARLVPFAGWEMPVSYEGIRAEHQAVREHAGVFDVSHMGEIETSGPDAEAFLQRVLSNDVTKLADGGAQYSVLCQDDGGLHDVAMLAVQGPEARAIVAGITDGELPKRFKTATLTVAGQDGVLVCGTGYTGEDGVELIVPAAGATAVWDAVTEGGAVPAGLGARDTLRLEVCFHLYGNDLMTTRGPIEAGLGWCCKEDTGFVGADAVRALPGTEIEIDVRGKVRTAEVREKPLYKHKES